MTCHLPLPRRAPRYGRPIGISDMSMRPYVDFRWRHGCRDRCTYVGLAVLASSVKSLVAPTMNATCAHPMCRT